MLLHLTVNAVLESNLEETGTILERKQQKKINQNLILIATFLLLRDLPYDNLWIFFDLHHFSLISCYAIEDICQILNQSIQRLIFIILTPQSLISYYLNVRNLDEISVFLICKPNSSFTYQSD